MELEASTDEWPADQWPRFVELLRAFCLSDAEQDALFPDLQEPRYHASNEGDGYTLCSYSPVFSDVYDLCAAYFFRCEEDDRQMFLRISALFRRADEQVLEPVKGREFPHAPRTNHTALRKIRPELRALCLEALTFWDEEIRAPTMSWEEMVPQ